MQLGMVGLGRMGANMTRRLMRGGHTMVVSDLSADAVKGSPAKARWHPLHLTTWSANSPRRAPPGSWCRRAIPRKKPCRLCSRTCRRATPSSTAAIPISKTTSAARRCAAAKGVHYVDVGTSGGVWGLERGYCMMIGGPKEAVQRLDPIFKTLAPGRGDIPRTPGREKMAGRPLAPPKTDTSTAAPPAPDISSRWSTTASNTD